MGCDELVKILSAEKKDLMDEIEKHKWHLSQKEGKDVGWQIATKDYLLHHLDDWAEGYRKCYCRFVCENVSCEDKERMKAKEKEFATNGIYNYI